MLPVGSPGRHVNESPEMRDGARSTALPRLATFEERVGILDDVETGTGFDVPAVPNPME